MNSSKLPTRTRAELLKIALNHKQIRGVHIITMETDSYKSVRGWTENFEFQFVFLGKNLTRRERGGHIRRGIKFLKKMEAKNEK